MLEKCQQGGPRMGSSSIEAPDYIRAGRMLGQNPSVASSSRETSIVKLSFTSLPLSSSARCRWITSGAAQGLHHSQVVKQQRTQLGRVGAAHELPYATRVEIQLLETFPSIGKPNRDEAMSSACFGG
jgi:hypothetical protein